MKATNSLTSHHGESNSSRADKMSGWIKRYKKAFKDRSSFSIAKQISNKKRRMFLKNKENWDKI